MMRTRLKPRPRPTRRTAVHVYVVDVLITNGREHVVHANVPVCRSTLDGTHDSVRQVASQTVRAWETRRRITVNFKPNPKLPTAIEWSGPKEVTQRPCPFKPRNKRRAGRWTCRVRVCPKPIPRRE